MAARQQVMLYEAAKPSKRRKRPARVSSDPNRETAHGADELRSQARYADQNHDLVTGVLDELEKNIVGSGINPEPQIKTIDGKPAKDLNSRVAEFHRKWARRPEVSRVYNNTKAQKLACRSWMRDGEIFTQLLSGRVTGLKHSTEIPFSFELIEADYVPIGYTIEDNLIFQGVQRNKWGQPKFYFAAKNQPFSGSSYSVNDYRRIKAENMLQLALTDRVKQGRGVSILKNTLVRFYDVKEYEDYERIAARWAAAMTGVITTDPMTPGVQFNSSSDNEKDEYELAPGAIWEMEAGQDVKSLQSNRPSNLLQPYRAGQLQAASAGTRTSYSAISRNYDGSYSSRRQEANEMFAGYVPLQGEFIDQFEQPKYDRFIMALQASGLLGSLDQIDLSSLDDCSWSAPQMPQIDPNREMSSYEKASKNSFMSKTTIQRKLGLNPQHQREQIAVENEASGGLVNDNQN